MTRILGLTGSIGMGKTTTAAMFRDMGVPVWDADSTVHALYAPGGAAVDPVAARFPDVVIDGMIDRAALKRHLTADPSTLATLESIVHPLVAQSRTSFITDHRARGTPLVVLDVPLLFETGGDARCDATVVVTAPAETQRQRVLARPGMTADALDQLLARQMPDAEKRARATHVITTETLDSTRAQVRALIDRYRHA
jgi:dephospho-CoA kinase